MGLSRRHFLAVSAVVAMLPQAPRAAENVGFYRIGQALGAPASIRLDHPDAESIAARCAAEITRLDNILSLYQPDSAVTRLNRDGSLEAPPFELLDCLSLAGRVWEASGGRFDVTVQPLWALWAEAAAKGRRPDQAELQAARARTGWEKVRFDENRIELAPGMALTLNGLGQGYVADSIARLLQQEGLDNILIDTGEFRAIGGDPAGGDWPITLESGARIGLKARGLATSSPFGTTFDGQRRDGHILDPSTGAPVISKWQSISISDASAALADALATAACLTRTQEELDQLIGAFPAARIEAAQPA